MQWISADQVFDGHHLLAQHAIGITDGTVSAVRATHDLAPNQITAHYTGTLSPGFCDIQVNGGGGALLNTAPTPAGIATIIAAHRRFGTTALMPTVITDAPEVLEAAVAATLAAKDTQGLAGLHIEGPHIAQAKRGTHACAHIRPCDQHTLHLIQQLRAADIPTLITLAPEAATIADVTALRDCGAIVSIGHSNATAEQVAPFLKAGAACFTHLFNAMSPMQARAPGVTGAAIASDAYCSIIADGIHVDPAMVRLAIRARPKAHRMIAVSDAMATVGGADHFTLYGQDIHLKDGRLINAEGALAGAHLTMLEALQNLIRWGIAPETAFQMCRSNPFTLIGQPEQAALIGQDIADIIVLDRALGLISVGLTSAQTDKNTA